MSERQRISRARAIESKCHRCCGEYFDGKMDCEITDCPLYSFMPYRKLKPNLDWQQYSPRRKGLVSWVEIHNQEPTKNGTDNLLDIMGGGIPVGTDGEDKSYRKRRRTEQQIRTGDGYGTE